MTTCIAERRKRLADEFLVGEGAIDLGCVEEGDAALEGCADDLDHLLLVARRPISIAHAHAAKAESRHFQTTVSKFSLLHNRSKR